MELWELSASELTQAYQSRNLKPSEVVETLLTRIDQLDPLVGAFRQVFHDHAHADASASDHRLTDGGGPLEGIPVAIKELFDVAGADGSYGSRVLAGRVASEDAEAVRRLRAAGAIVIGTTRSNEFGWGITTQHESLGSTVNPWDPSRVPGGSSGGSAAALATGMVPLALGSDTGGSIRIPAAFCGVVGFKPTYGRVSKRGAVSLAPSLDHPGPMARTVADANTALGVLAGHDSLDPSTRRRPMTHRASQPRVGVCPDLHTLALSDDHSAIFDQVVSWLSVAGFEVNEMAFPHADRIRPAFNVIQMVEAYHYHTAVMGTYPSRSSQYGADVRHRLELASKVGLANFLEALTTAQQVRATFESLFDHVDVIVTPVTAGGPSSRETPDKVMHRGDWTPFRDVVMGYTVPQDLSGLPALTVPVALDGDGIPVGVQFTAAWDHEASAAAVAEQMAVDLGWPPIEALDQRIRT